MRYQVGLREVFQPERRRNRVQIIRSRRDEVPVFKSFRIIGKIIEAMSRAE